MSWLGAARVELDTCGSTNDEAARLARGGAAHGTVVIARAQTGGRGRAGRVWQSPPGLGLYLSAIVRPPIPLGDVPPMTLAIGLGVCDAARAAGAPAELKWPNDVVVIASPPPLGAAARRGEAPTRMTRKLAGVLVEAQSQGHQLEAVIVGIGVNLTGELPAPVADFAITLAAAGGRPTIDRDAFLASLLGAVEHWLDVYVASGLPTVIPAWHERMARDLVVRATVDGGAQVVGVVTGLDLDGAALVRDELGLMHRARSGDLELVHART